jgi:hypothetical protein
MADSNNANQPRRDPRLVLFLVCVGLFMVAINARAMIVSLPTLTEVFHTNLSLIQWALLVYDLAVIGLVLTLSRLGDLFGRKWIYIIGLLLFTLGSALCGLVQSPGQLIACRIVQGMGGAMIMAHGRAIASIVVPVSQRGKALGLTSMAYHVGYMTGPTLVRRFYHRHDRLALDFLRQYSNRPGKRLLCLENSPRAGAERRTSEGRLSRRGSPVDHQYLFRLCDEPVSASRLRPSAGSVLCHHFGRSAFLFYPH